MSSSWHSSERFELKTGGEGVPVANDVGPPSPRVGAETAPRWPRGIGAVARIVAKRTGKNGSGDNSLYGLVRVPNDV